MSGCWKPARWDSAPRGETVAGARRCSRVPARIADEYGRSAAIAMQRAMFDTVDEVGTVIEQEGIDCDWARGGTLMMAHGAAQVTRAHDHLAEYRGSASTTPTTAGWTPTSGPARPRQRPARRHLHASLRGDRPTETGPRAGRRRRQRRRTRPRTHPRPGRLEGAVRTPGGTLRAGTSSARPRPTPPCFPATAATSRRSLADDRDRTPAGRRLEQHRPGPPRTFSDLRHVLIYGQRTADDRFAFGGRGAPLQLGDPDPASTTTRGCEHLRQTLIGLFAGLDDVEITDRWGGVLGIARDWWARVTYDRRPGWEARAATSATGSAPLNLAGRTLAHLVAGSTPI